MKKLVFFKAREFPIGHISTSKDGQKTKKVGPGKWVPVVSGSSQKTEKISQGSGKSIAGLTFKDGFYFDGKAKISNNYEKAKKYADKKDSGSSGSSVKSIKVGDKIRVKSNAKSNGKVTEHKARGMIAKVKEIGDKFVRIVDETGKVFQVNKMALEFAKSGIIVNDYDLIKSDIVKKSKVLSFNLTKSNSKLEKIKKLLISLLNKNIEKSSSLDLQFFDLIKGKGYPLGTKREWKGKKFIKIASGKWRRFYEGESRGQKQSIRYITKQIEKAKTIAELAKIVFENRKRFTNSDGTRHKIVNQLLDLAKGKKPEPKKEEKKIKVMTGEKLKIAMERRKQKLSVKKEEEYIPTPVEKEAIETNEEIQTKEAIEIDTEIKLGENVSELRNGENYYNEKPAEILNTGKEVLGAARHKFDTYEISNVNLGEMEEQGVAKKIITKGNLVTEPSLDGLDERVKDGEQGAKILLENFVYKILRSAPADDSKARDRYNNFCKILNRSTIESKTALELYSSLVSNTQEYATAATKGISFEETKVMGTGDAKDVLGKELLFFLHPQAYRYLSMSSFREKAEINSTSVKYINKMIAALVDSEKGKEINESEAKRIVIGEKYILEEKGIGSIKKGDKIRVKSGVIDLLAIVRSRYKSLGDRDLHNEELNKARADVEVKISAKLDEILKDYKKTNPKYKQYKTMYEDQAKQSIKWQTDKYVKKDGTLSKNGIKKYESVAGFSKWKFQIRKKAIANTLNASIENATDIQNPSYQMRSKLMKEARKSIDEKYLTYTRIKPQSNVVVGSSNKGGFTAIMTFDNGQVYERRFTYDDVDTVLEKQQTTRGKKRKSDFYTETKANRKGGTDKYNTMSASEIQKDLHDNFKLKSTTFGNSMTDKERAFHLQKTAESFSDLSEILKLDHNVVSANGKLGVAYGSFGGLQEGGTAANYRPDQSLIALTRNKGFGSFAHEWMHFIDNMVAPGGGKSEMMSQSGGIMQKVNKVPEIIPDGSILITKKKTKSGNITETKYYYDKTGNKHYPFVKINKKAVKPTGDDSKEKRYNFGNYSLKSMIENDRYSDMNDLLIPDQKGNNKNHNEMQKLMSDISTKMQLDLADREAETKGTMLEEDFKELQGQYFNNSYYNSPEECLARGFEVYLSDKLVNMKRENTYLTSQNKTKSHDGLYVFPQDEQKRKEISRMFEKLFDNIRKSDDLKKSIDLIFGKNDKKLVFFKSSDSCKCNPNKPSQKCEKCKDKCTCEKGIKGYCESCMKKKILIKK